MNLEGEWKKQSEKVIEVTSVSMLRVKQAYCTVTMKTAILVFFFNSM